MKCSDIKTGSIRPCGPDLFAKQYSISNDGDLFENGILKGKVLTYALTSHGIHVLEFRDVSGNPYSYGKILKITSTSLSLNGS
jgi:hypothetical protein